MYERLTGRLWRRRAARQPLLLLEVLLDVRLEVRLERRDLAVARLIARTERPLEQRRLVDRLRPRRRHWRVADRRRACLDLRMLERLLVRRRGRRRRHHLEP